MWQVLHGQISVLPLEAAEAGHFHPLPVLVEHAEISQRVEAGMELPGPRTDGTGASGTNWAALVSTDCPEPKKGGEAPWERQAGSTGFGGSTGLRGHQVHSGPRPAGAHPYLASTSKS